MVDKITRAKRSKNMAAIKSTNTNPELKIRKILHKAGYRFRIHPKELPGKPDIILPKHRTAIFVHGCFWHYHNCNVGRMPKSNADFWRSKIKKNLAKDKKNVADLRRQGWRILIVWECLLKGKNKWKDNRISEALSAFIESTAGQKALAGSSREIS